MAASSESSHPIATRDRILDAAEVLFAERGLAGTAVRDIARAVGLTPASLYNHFAGKQELYDAVLERGVRPLLELMRQLQSGDSALESRTALIASLMAELQRHPHLPRLVQHEVISGGAYVTKLARDWIRPLVEQGIAAMKGDGDSYWEEHEYALMMGAWLHLVFGHFAMAPLLAAALDDDPLSPESLARQTRFLQKLARTMAEGRGTPAPKAPPAGADAPDPSQDDPLEKTK